MTHSLLAAPTRGPCVGTVVKGKADTERDIGTPQCYHNACSVRFVVHHFEFKSVRVPFPVVAVPTLIFGAAVVDGRPFRCRIGQQLARSNLDTRGALGRTLTTQRVEGRRSARFQ